MLEKFILAGLFFLSLASTPFFACSCIMPSSPCNTSWKLGDSIFLGTVSAVVDADRGREIHFAVQESFRGTDPAGSEVLVYTGRGGGDCGYPFVVGTAYL